MNTEISNEWLRYEEKGATIQYLGQAGFLFKRRGVTVLIDPYLSDLAAQADSIWMRRYPPPIKPSALKDVDLVLCTHDHGDHTDPESLLGIFRGSPACRFAGPRASAKEMEKAGIPSNQISILNQGSVLTVGGLTIEPIAAAHEEYEVDSGGFHRYVGYILLWDGITFYHSGDTLVTPELERTLSAYKISVGFLPINGRNEKRRKMGIVGNMNAVEALNLATSLAKRKGFGLLVPMHYDLYAINDAQPEDFVNIWDKTSEPKPSFKLFRPGEQIVYADM